MKRIKPLTSELGHNLHSCLLDLDVSGLDLNSENLARGVGVGLELTEVIHLELLLLGRESKQHTRGEEESLHHTEKTRPLF